MDKVALVTGSSGGIGYEFAKLLAQDKHDLVLVARSSDKLNDIKKDFEQQYNIKVLVLPIDLSLPQSPEKIFDELNSKDICVKILINNAGSGKWGPYSKLRWENERQMLQLNMISLAHLTKLFLNGMIERKSGKIVNVASTAAFQPGPLMAVYYATKAFVLSYSESIANELRGTGITVTVLCPGFTETGFQKAAGISRTFIFRNRKIPTAEDVAKYGYMAMQKGKSVAIYSFFNRFVVFCVRLLPRSVVANIVRKVQETRS